MLPWHSLSSCYWISTVIKNSCEFCCLRRQQRENKSPRNIEPITWLIESVLAQNNRKWNAKRRFFPFEMWFIRVLLWQRLIPFSFGFVVCPCSCYAARSKSNNRTDNIVMDHKLINQVIVKGNNGILSKLVTMRRRFMLNSIKRRTPNNNNSLNK